MNSKKADLYINMGDYCNLTGSIVMFIKTFVCVIRFEQGPKLNHFKEIRKLRGGLKGSGVQGIPSKTGPVSSNKYENSIC